MRLLVLGGTRFVGRAVVADALDRGWEVTVLNRGRTGVAPASVDTVLADRTDDRALRAAIRGREWDIVVDTWAGSPRVVEANARLLREHVARYAYISSVSVYRWGMHLDESSPVVDGCSGPDVDSDYASAKRGSELAVSEHFPDALLARAGLILGPHEDIGRLPWWLRRIAAGGRVVAPGAPERPLQYVDARDLAAFVLSNSVLSSSAAEVGGPFDVASASGHATTSELLTACIDVTASDAELVWVSEERLADAGAQPWIHLPCWVPQYGDTAGFLESDTSRAATAGLECRPVQNTVEDTWTWMQREPTTAQRPDRPVHGLPADIELELLERPEGGQ